MTATRHAPTDDCDGQPIIRWIGARSVPVVRCPECHTPLCACEVTYGHDCEDESTPECPMCHGSGVFSGPVSSVVHYAGPCVCQTAPDEVPA